MFDIPFENFDVVYFDPPYQNTTGYQRGTFSQIMFKALLKVLIDSGKMVFVSEYNAPADGFVEVASFKKQMTLKSDENRTATERLFFGGTLEQYKALGLDVLDDTVTEPEVTE